MELLLQNTWAIWQLLLLLIIVAAVKYPYVVLVAPLLFTAIAAVRIALAIKGGRRAV